MAVKTELQKQDDIADRIWKLFEIVVVGLYSFFVNSIREAYLGNKNGHMPVLRLLKLSSAASLFFSLKIDLRLLKILSYFIPDISLSAPTGLLRVILWIFCAIAPFLFWGWRRYKILQAVIKYLHATFATAGLVSNGKTPRLIRDYITDTDSRVLQFLSDGVTVTEMLAKKETLENQLSVKIESIKMDKKFNKLIEIEFATSELTKFYPLDNVFGFRDFTFPIGKTRTELIMGDLKKIPHYLFAGISGSGKSSFIKTMTVTLLKNNDDLKVYFVDLKGSEAPNLIGYDRLLAATEEQEAYKLINTVKEEIDRRKQKFTALKSKDLESYNTTVIRLGRVTDILPRILLIVDEIAEVMPNGTTKDHKGAKEAVRLINWVARTGRSFGVNLIVAVQKPDTQNIDSTTKANLEGILCFQVANRIQSQVVLDNSKAVDLEGIKGRAVWQTSSDEIILQTPFISEQLIQKLKGECSNVTVNDGDKSAPRDAGQSESNKEDSADCKDRAWGQYNSKE